MNVSGSAPRRSPRGGLSTPPAPIPRVSVHSYGTPPRRLPAFGLDKASQENAVPFENGAECQTLYHPGNKVLTPMAFYIKHRQHLPAPTRECRAQSTRSPMELFVHFCAKGRREIAASRPADKESSSHPHGEFIVLAQSSLVTLQNLSMPQKRPLEQMVILHFLDWRQVICLFSCLPEC